MSQVISTIKTVNAELVAYDMNGEFMANIQPTTGRKEEYLILWYGGKWHGKSSYAMDWQDLNDKVSFVSKENNK